MLELAPELEAALGAAQTLVVPSAQRAAALRLGFAVQQLARGQRAFRTPDVHSLSGWLRAQHARVAIAGATRRLGASEEWLLWREAVTEAAARQSLPASAGLIDAVRESVSLLHEWCIPAAALTQSPTPETALLSESLAGMEARLHALKAAAPWRALADLAADPPRRPPAFAGFQGATPARRALLAAWAQRGQPAQEFSATFPDALSRVVSAADPAEELVLMAEWCGRRLLADPAARLLLIVPELSQRADEVRRVFDAALDPGYLERGATEREPVAYALEGGQPLLSYAPVALSLRTLRVLSGEVELAELSQWLRSAVWISPAAGPRALLDVWLRGVAPPRLNATQLLQALRAAPGALLPVADGIAEPLTRALEVLGSAPLSLASWSTRFMRVLEIFALHAGTARQHSSHTQQVLQRWAELLQECAALPAGAQPSSAAEAVVTLTQLLARTRFEPATGDAAVTISASLADPILRYDGIWASGLHAGVLPAPARFDPFIPVALQRRAGLIDADATALVARAQQELATLRRCSAELVLSAPAHADDLELAVSPLLAPYAAFESTAVPPRGAELAQIVRGTPTVETYADEPGVAWPTGVTLPGSRAIELQSRCAFHAYAELRLGARAIEAPVPGISPRERGTLMHRALELLWHRLGGSVGLATARAAATLSGLIAESVAQAAGEILRTVAEADTSGLLELRRAAIVREHARAQRLIGRLCELEATRTPFVIQELEAEHTLQIGGAHIKVRIDRMDRLADGSHVILDYKTGRVVNPDWEGERTTHPQLLVYLLAAGLPVSTLAVAHLDPKDVVLRGIADADDRLPGVPGLAAHADAAQAAQSAWARQTDVWREQVRQLAADFVAGVARVDPVAKACDHCHLQAFCRVAQLAVDDEGSDPDPAVRP